MYAQYVRVRLQPQLTVCRLIFSRTHALENNALLYNFNLREGWSKNSLSKEPFHALTVQLHLITVKMTETLQSAPCELQRLIS